MSAGATMAALAARDRMKQSVARAAPDTRLAVRVETVSVTIASAPTALPTGLAAGRPFLALHVKDVAANVDAARGTLCARVALSFFDAGAKMAWEPCVEPFVFALQMANGACPPTQVLLRRECGCPAARPAGMLARLCKPARRQRPCLPFHTLVSLCGLHSFDRPFLHGAVGLRQVVQGAKTAPSLSRPWSPCPSWCPPAC